MQPYIREPETPTRPTIDPQPASGKVPRSPEWPRFARAHLQAEPACAVCGPLFQPTTPVQVHHIFPVHFCRAVGRGDLELDARNVVTLCVTVPPHQRSGREVRQGEDHHLVVGHLGDFEIANPGTRADAKSYFGMTSKAIKASADWRSKVTHRLPPLPKMSPGQRQALRALMDQMMPLARG